MCVSTRALWLAVFIFKVFNYVVPWVESNIADQDVEIIKQTDYEFVAYLNVLS
jgi:hypothetical protein